MTKTMRQRWIESITDQQVVDLVVLCIRSALATTPADLVEIERICDAAGLTLISQQTADELDRLHARQIAGLPVDELELARVRYAVVAATPPARPKVLSFAGEV